MNEIVLLRIEYKNKYYYKSELGCLYNKNGEFVGVTKNNKIYIFNETRSDKYITEAKNFINSFIIGQKIL